ncbi:hypothetical protein BH09VER1_BH09VER1_25580 [soil metagenome]
MNFPASNGLGWHPVGRDWMERAFSLVEVAIALGIISFCLVALMGMFPVMLESIRQSREKTLVAEMFQTIAEDLRNTAPSNNEKRTYEFDADGFLLTTNASRLVVRTNAEVRYGAVADCTFATVPLSHGSSNLMLAQVLMTNKVRKGTNLQRPVWIVK